MSRIVATATSPRRFLDDWSHTACTALPPSDRGVAVKDMKPPGCKASASTIVSVTVPGCDQS